jgi:hypothetical protein
MMHGYRDIREMSGSDYVDFLKNRVLGWAEIYRVCSSKYYTLPVKKSREPGSPFVTYLQFNFFILYFVFYLLFFLYIFYF